MESPQRKKGNLFYNINANEPPIIHKKKLAQLKETGDDVSRSESPPCNKQ